MPSEAAAWCGGVLGAACTGESRCSGRGFLRGIVGLCGGSARHVERGVPSRGCFRCARARRDASAAYPVAVVSCCGLWRRVAVLVFRVRGGV